MMKKTEQSNSKRKILFLLEAFDKGGIEKVTLDIVNSLDPEKYDITVQTFWYGGTCQSQVNDNIKVIPFFFKRYVRGIIRLIQILPASLLHRLFIREKYDVEIGASDGGAAKVISGSKDPDSRKIAWIHMDVVERGSKLPEFENAKTAEKIYSKFDTIACVSEACKEKFEMKFGTGYPVVVKKNPIPVKEILRKSAEPVDFPKTKGVEFVCVGRLEDEKGFDRLIRVCDRLCNHEGYHFHVSIIGEGSKRKELEEQMASCHLEDTIKLLGFRSNPYPYLKQADVFLLTSRDESFCIVVGESLILDTPVIATDCAGIREWLGENENGLVLENSEEGIYRGMKTVLDDPSVLKTYHGNSKIEFESVLKEFEELLQK